jgi:hypothetical protein
MMDVVRPVRKHRRCQDIFIAASVEINNKGRSEMEIQAVVALVVGVVVVLFVPALVWSAVISGLLQMVRDKLRGSVRSTSKPVSVKAE